MADEKDIVNKIKNRGVIYDIEDSNLKKYLNQELEKKQNKLSFRSPINETSGIVTLATDTTVTDSTNPIQSGAVKNALKLKADKTELGDYTKTVDLPVSNWNETDQTSKSYIQNKPTTLGAFTNDQGFITNTVDNLTNYYTTSNTYSKTEVDTLLSAISSLKIEKVTELPTENISKSTIYLLPKTTAQTNNIYDEYIYVKNKDDENYHWELIGDTTVDLSGYLTAAETLEMLNGKESKITTLPITKGGTGANTVKAAQYNLLSSMNSVESNLSANDEIVVAYDENSKSEYNGALHTRKLSTISNYVKSLFNYEQKTTAPFFEWGKNISWDRANYTITCTSNQNNNNDRKFNSIYPYITDCVIKIKIKTKCDVCFGLSDNKTIENFGITTDIKYSFRLNSAGQFSIYEKNINYGYNNKDKMIEGGTYPAYYDEGDEFRIVKTNNTIKYYRNDNLERDGCISKEYLYGLVVFTSEGEINNFSFNEINSFGLAKVATSGNYNDLLNKLELGTTSTTAAAGDHNHDSDYSGINHNHDTTYVKQVTGKDLSTNDFTTALKNKLNNINLSLYQLKIEEKTQEEYNSLTETEKAGKLFVITDATSGIYTGVINDNAIAADTTWSSYKIDTNLRNTLKNYSQIGHIHEKSDIRDFPTDLGDFTNGPGYTKNIGTITEITMNGSSKGSSGVVDLGTVLTEHQSLKTINNQTITGSGNLSVGTYSKPIEGIPKTDLSNNVQSSLEKADTALQEHQDLSNYVTTSRKVNGLALSSDISIITTTTQANYNKMTSAQRAGKLFVITDATSGIYTGVINDNAIAADTTWSSSKITNQLNTKQTKLIAGSGITIDGDEISADTIGVATSSNLGTIKLGSNTKQTVAANAVTSKANRTYAVQLNSANQAVVNVPWIDTQSGDTNYTIGMSGNTLTLTGTDGTTQTINFSNLPYAGNGYLGYSGTEDAHYKYIILCKSSENFRIAGILLMCRNNDNKNYGIKVDFSVVHAPSDGDYSLNYSCSNSGGWAKLVKITIDSVEYIAISLYTGNMYWGAYIYWNITKSGSPADLGKLYAYTSKQTVTELIYSPYCFNGEIKGTITNATNATNDKNGNDITTSYAAKSHNHTKSQITDFPTLAPVATSGSYNDLSNKPTILSLGNTSTTAAAGDHNHDTTYVKKETGKGLSTNDFTTTLKNKLDNIESGAQKNTITGVKGDSETSYKTGNVNITKANIGLENVGNFKAVSTEASQGLTATEKSNARSNIGAGTSSLTIGTTSTTAAAGNHNHDDTYLGINANAVTATQLNTQNWRHLQISKSGNSGLPTLAIIADVTDWYGIKTSNKHHGFTGFGYINRPSGNMNDIPFQLVCRVAYDGTNLNSSLYIRLYTTSSYVTPILVEWTNPDNSSEKKYYIGLKLSVNNGSYCNLWGKFINCYASAVLVNYITDSNSKNVLPPEYTELKSGSYLDWNGNAATSTNATNDKNGNDITTSYAAKSHNHDSTYLKLSGGTVTGKTNFSNALVIPISAPTSSILENGCIWVSNAKGTTPTTTSGSGTSTGTINATFKYNYKSLLDKTFHQWGIITGPSSIVSNATWDTGIIPIYKSMKSTDDFVIECTIEGDFPYLEIAIYNKTTEAFGIKVYNNTLATVSNPKINVKIFGYMK